MRSNKLNLSLHTMKDENHPHVSGGHKVGSYSGCAFAQH